MHTRIARYRPVAFLALVAMLLVAVMPTVSQLRAAWGSAHGGVMHHVMAGGTERDHCTDDHSRPDDCFKKCGYCDFLGHTPSLAGVPHLAIPLAPALERVVARAHAPLRPAARFNAAHPRGPPPLLV